MTKTTPYLLFQGNCAEAMQFYAACCKAQLTVMSVGNSPMKAQFPPELQDKIINAELHGDGIDLTASDWLLPTRTPQQGNTVCVYVSGAPYEKLREYFDALSEGADPNTRDELRDMPFGSYGALTDKFGVRWMFQGDKAA